MVHHSIISNIPTKPNQNSTAVRTRDKAQAILIRNKEYNKQISISTKPSHSKETDINIYL
jgi:hypothetical protein